MKDIEASIIIPTFNMIQFLPRSLRICLRQTIENLEVIVVDDGSSDGTFDFLQEFASSDPRVRPIRQSHTGVPAIARNLGLSVAQGRYIQFLDADDHMWSRKLEFQIKLMRRNASNRVVAYCDYRIIRPNELRKRPFREGPPDGSYWPSDFRTLFAMHTVLHRFLYPIEVLREHGAFDESLTHAEDLDLWIRLVVGGVPFVYDPRPMVLYCQQDGSHSLRSPHAEAQCRLRVLEKLSKYLKGQGLLNQYRSSIAACTKMEARRISELEERMWK
jgi:glycosyltransferase involved in cell wall biosynthesis